MKNYLIRIRRYMHALPQRKIHTTPIEHCGYSLPNYGTLARNEIPDLLYVLAVSYVNIS